MKKTWKIIVPVLAILAVAAIVLSVVLGLKAGRKAEAKKRTNSIGYYFADEEGVTHFLSDDKLLDDHIAGYVDSFLTCDGTVGIARAGTGLYRADKDGILLIYPAGVDRALLSLDGNLIVFTTATQLHIYDHRTGKLVDVKFDDIYGIASIALSPDGSTVGYTVKAKDGEYRAFAYENGESRELGSGAYIMAVSDGAASYYYIEPEDVVLHYVSGSKDRLIGKGVSSLVEFNRDLTEALFDIDGVTHYSREGSAAKPLVKGASVYSVFAECESVQGGETCTSAVKDCDTFFGGVFYKVKSSSADSDATAYDLWYVDGRAHVTDLVKGATQFYMVDGGEKLCCTVDNTVYIMNSSDPSSREVICNNTHSFCVTPDGKSFYCIGYDFGLYYVEPRTQPVQLASNAVHCMLDHNGRCLYLTDYSEGGRLHSISGAEGAKDIAGNVARIEVLPAASLYYTSIYDDSLGKQVYDVYASADGVEFTKVVECVPVSTGEE